MSEAEAQGPTYDERRMALRRAEFLDRVRSAINCACMENGSNTPDFLLAEYLLGCLDSFDKAVMARDAWFGRRPSVIGVSAATEAAP